MILCMVTLEVVKSESLALFPLNVRIVGLERALEVTQSKFPNGGWIFFTNGP